MKNNNLFQLLASFCLIFGFLMNVPVSAKDAMDTKDNLLTVEVGAGEQRNDPAFLKTEQENDASNDETVTSNTLRDKENEESDTAPTLYVSHSLTSNRNTSSGPGALEVAELSGVIAAGMGVTLSSQALMVQQALVSAGTTTAINWSLVGEMALTGVAGGAVVGALIGVGLLWYFS